MGRGERRAGPGLAAGVRAVVERCTCTVIGHRWGGARYYRIKREKKTHRYLARRCLRCRVMDRVYMGEVE